MGLLKSIIVPGMKSGRLTVAQLHDKGRREYWECLCSCGKTKIVEKSHLVRKDIQSCGCLQKERASKAAKLKIKHGESRTRLFGVWTGMLDRCRNQNHKFYNDYGGRGIQVCPQWQKDFVCFREWAIISGYQKGLWLDRTDNYGDYTPENCRWVSAKISGRNKRNNVYLHAFGECKIVSEWVEDSRCVVNRPALVARIDKHGWDVETALTQPLRNKRHL